MLSSIQLAVLLCGVMLWCLAAGQSCTSCGPECVPACGSRRYRTCCFNYLRKRRSSQAPGMPPAEDAEHPDNGLFGLVLMPDSSPYQDMMGPQAAGASRRGSAGAGSRTFLHRLLDVDTGDAAARTAPDSHDTLQRTSSAGDIGGERDWLGDLRRRVSLVYNS